MTLLKYNIIRSTMHYNTQNGLRYDIIFISNKIISAVNLYIIYEKSKI